MTAIAVVAAKSSPGVSTVAELLALLAPSSTSPILVDADPAGGEWLLRPGVAPEPGLASLAMAGRRGLAAGEVAAHLQHVGDGRGVLVAPAAARQASAALDLVGRALAGVLGELNAVVDCGSLSESSPAMPLVQAADLVVAVSRPSAAALVHLAPWVDQLRGEGAAVAVVLSAAGPRPRTDSSYRPAEVADALGVEVLGTMADDPDAVARLWAEPGRRAALERTRLVRSMAPVAEAAFARAEAAVSRTTAESPMDQEVVR